MLTDTLKLSIAIELLNSRIGTMQEHLREGTVVYSPEDIEDYFRSVGFLIANGKKYSLTEAKEYLNQYAS